MLVVFNPTAKAVRRGLPLDLYYTSLVETAVVTDAMGTKRTLPLDRFSRTRLEVEVPAGGFTWFAIDSGQ